MAQWEHRSLVKSEPKPAICPPASEFQAWVGQYLSMLGTEPTPAQIIVAKADVTDKYFAYWSAVGKDCKYRAHPKGHFCIWHVFMDALHQLRAIELHLPQRQQLMTPAPPLEPPPAIFLGPLVGRETDADE